MAGSLNSYVVEIDWNGDGDFADTGEDITSYVLGVQTMRGRDFASQLTGQSRAGQCVILLDNRDGRFSRFNSSSPLYGNLLPGRKVRVRATAPTAATLWAGYLASIDPAAGALPTAVLRASGPFVRISGNNAKVSPAAQESKTTGLVIGAVLDAMSIPSGDQVIEAGSVEILRWYQEDIEAIRAIQEMEETEQGFFYESVDWDFVFEGRYHRDVTTASLVSQATISDDANPSLTYEEVSQSDPLREIFNEVEVTVQPYLDGDAGATLWTLSNELPSLGPGVSRTYIATAGSDVAYVKSWTTPVVGTDITQSGVSNSDLAVSVTKTARTMFITVTNNHGSATALLTLMQARGQAVSKLNAFKLTASNSSSQTAYGRRTYPLTSPWYFNGANAEAAQTRILARYKDPHPTLEVTLPAGTDDSLFAQAVSRVLSDRITLKAQNFFTKLGINSDFYIEAIGHAFGPPGTPLVTTWFLSEASADPGYWVLEVSDDLGTDTILAA